jgi:hypothetical protein
MNHTITEEQREKQRAAYLRWASAHPDRKREHELRWRLANPDWKREYKRGWYVKNQDKAIEYARRWAKDNPEKRRENEHNRRAKMFGAEHIKMTPEQHAILRSTTHCYICGGRFKVGDSKHTDHVTPVILGGQDVFENKRMTHAKCNLRKGSRIIELPLVWRRP